LLFTLSRSEIIPEYSEMEEENSAMEKKNFDEVEEEDRHFRRYRKFTKESRHDFGGEEEFVSPGPFEPLWDGRG
jgi:hypothetical protein